MSRAGLVGAAAVAAFVCGVGVARGEGEATEGEAPARAPEGKEKKKSGGDVVGRISSEFSTYSDTDAVTVFTPTIGATIENPIAEWSLSARYLVDVVSAASVDIVATASRSWREVRNAGNFDAAKKFGDFGAGVSGSVSNEPDYLGVAGGGHVSLDFFEKNVTTLVGYAYGHDVIGRHMTPWSVFSHNVDTHTVTAAFNVIVNRSTLLALVGDVIVENGDTSKPYRYIPMFSAQVAPTVPNGASIDKVNALRLPERPLEQLPTKRDRFALTARLAHRFTSSTVRLEERFYQDTWGLTATSTDLAIPVDAGSRVTIGPHARLHLQAPVAFWKRAYVSNFGSGGWNLPALRTGNRELGPLRSLTGGGGINLKIGPDTDPGAWVLGFRGDAIWTSFLDDLYVTDRVSGFGAVTLDAVFE